MDGVLHLVSPDPPIRRNTSVPVQTACASEQAYDQVPLRVDSINKQYADQGVLADVSFDIQAGEIIGIIGPNGAGKTTLVCTEISNPRVVMVKSAQDGVRIDETGSLNRPRIRRIFVQRPMCSDAIVVASVRFQNTAQMCLAQNNDVVQTLAPDRSDQPFGKAVLPR